MKKGRFYLQARRLHGRHGPSGGEMSHRMVIKTLFKFTELSFFSKAPQKTLLHIMF